MWQGYGDAVDVSNLHDVCHSLHDEPALAPSHPRPGALVKSLQHIVDRSGPRTKVALPPKGLLSRHC